MQKQKIARLVHLVTSTNINAYGEVPALEKEEFLSLARSYLRMIAKEMGLKTGEYDIRTNKAGIAVSGDVHLHTDNLYVAFEQSCLGNDFGFMYRSVANRKDYTGGRNQWMRWDNLLNVKAVVEIFRNVRHTSPGI